MQVLDTLMRVLDTHASAGHAHGNVSHTHASAGHTHDSVGHTCAERRVEEGEERRGEACARARSLPGILTSVSALITLFIAPITLVSALIS